MLSPESPFNKQTQSTIITSITGAATSSIETQKRVADLFNTELQAIIKQKIKSNRRVENPHQSIAINYKY
jgi:hypothetical protein